MPEPLKVGDKVRLRGRAAYEGVVCRVTYTKDHGRECAVSWFWWDPEGRAVFGIYKHKDLAKLSPLIQLAREAE
ncbi:unnamed protein product [marine sediment metagenome]|uniref:Uncharacterized protein n=1 Tax=marine sediment metagenome TaxID=412755 RepID=X0S2T5_9ZZZZ